MRAREHPELAELRWRDLELLQEHYKHFPDFARDMMAELGFGLTDIQEDIGQFMVTGGQYIMVQAQRSQAKTTIAACFAVWSLVHSPAHRVLIVSAGGTQANEISTLIVRLVMNVDVLACMRPDKQAGDRTSTEAFDVHHSLKGMDKSPSVACMGIEANMQGKRADLLISDDVESAKNGTTSTQRARILHLTKDFTSINAAGRIIWLGTPQTQDSIYNSLPARGVIVRIWPGRYPTPAQAVHYGTHLAPLLVERMRADPSLHSGGGLLGEHGKPIDPTILGEQTLQHKELDQGEAYFQLQHMLNTTLADSLRYPIKLERLVTMRTAGDNFPLTVVRGMTMDKVQDWQSAGFGFKTASPHEISRETSKLQSIWAYIDPAAGGANGDETAWAIGGLLNSNIFLLSAGGIQGGYELDKLEKLADILCQFKLDGVTIEKNMGHGAFAAVFTPILRRRISCQIDDDLVTGQKEKRLIETLTPVIGRGSLIISDAVIDEDDRYCMRHSAAVRQTYSLFYQLAKLTSDRNSLIHDDRADALEGLVRHFQPALAGDQAKNIKRLRERAYEEMMKNPLGYNLGKPPGAGYGSMLHHRKRKR